MTPHDTAISKTLSFWLRHRPGSARLTLDARGWTEIAPVLAALNAKGLEVDRARLDGVVAGSDKGRFELSSDGRLIRARQGHSVEVELGWPQVEPPTLLYHGTVDRFLPAIRVEGLKPMKRHHVHLSADRDTAAVVGARKGEAVILIVRSGEMAARGSTFFLTDNGVWLTDAVASEFLAE